MQVQISCAGNLVDDPSLRYTPAGHAVTNFRVAVSDRFQDRTTGEWKDTPPAYVSVTFWRKLAENVAKTLHKGDQAVIVGRLQQRDHQTEQHDKRTTYEIEADAVGAGLAHSTATTTRNPRTAGTGNL